MATIFCFSSTGNSLYAAKKIATHLDGTLISMTSNVAACNDDMIGFVFPVYFLTMPETVRSFIERLNITQPNPYLFAVATCGNLVFDLDGIVQKTLSPKHLKLAYFAKLRMVENYIPTYRINDTKACHEAAEKKLSKLIAALKARKHCLIKPIGLPNRIMSQFYPPTHQKTCDTDFNVTNCMSCGLCEKLCPMHNITLTADGPRFNGRCEFCLGCVHACPKQAINWRRRTQNKPRYHHPQIPTSELAAFLNPTQHDQ